MKKGLALRNGQEVTIRELALSDLGAIMKLQEKVIASLADVSFLQPLSKDEFLFILAGNGSMIGAFHNDLLIAFRAMLEPEIDEEHLGLDAGLEESELPRVLYSEVSNVDPDFRGNGLQQILGKILVENVDVSRHRYICTTVAPFNIASLKDKFALGMHIISLKNKYGDLLRYTMLKDLSMKSSTGNDTVLVDMSDSTRQQSLLNEGWVGINMKQENGLWKVEFRSEKQS